MRDFFVAFALLLAMEGIVFAAFPEGMRKALQDTASIPPKLLRIGGIATAILGIFCLWFLRNIL